MDETSLAGIGKPRRLLLLGDEGAIRKFRESLQRRGCRVMPYTLQVGTAVRSSWRNGTAVCTGALGWGLRVGALGRDERQDENDECAAQGRRDLRGDWR